MQFQEIIAIAVARETKSREATPQSAHKKFERGPGNWTRMSTYECLKELKNIVEIYFWGKIESCSAGLETATLRSIAHDYPIAPSPRLLKLIGETVILITDRCSYYYYYTLLQN